MRPQPDYRRGNAYVKRLRERRSTRNLAADRTEFRHRGLKHVAFVVPIPNNYAMNEAHEDEPIVTATPENVDQEQPGIPPTAEAIRDAIADVQTDREVLPRDTERSKKDALASAKVCGDYRGDDILVLDLTTITSEFDYFVIATAGSRRQMHAIVDEVDRVLEHGGHKRRSIEGYENTSWIVQDYGDIVLHVFLPDARELYDLENLWGDAPRVAWQAAE